MGTLLENEENIMIDSDFFGVLSDNPDHRLFGNPIESQGNGELWKIIYETGSFRCQVRLLGGMRHF